MFGPATLARVGEVQDVKDGVGGEPIPAQFDWQPKRRLVSLAGRQTRTALAERGIELREGMALRFHDVEAAELGRGEEIVAGRVTRWRGHWMLALDRPLDLEAQADRRVRRRRAPWVLAFLVVLTLVYGTGAVIAAINGSWFGVYFGAVYVVGLWWIMASLRFR